MRHAFILSFLLQLRSYHPSSLFIEKSIMTHSHAVDLDRHTMTDTHKNNNDLDYLSVNDLSLIHI